MPRVLWSIVRSLVTIRAPHPTGRDTVDHSALAEILSRLRGNAIDQVPEVDAALGDYTEEMEQVDPDLLTRVEALAYWLNLYNASALRLTAATARRGIETVLGLPGGFTSAVVSVAGERLSLDEWLTSMMTQSLLPP